MILLNGLVVYYWAVVRLRGINKMEWKDDYNSITVRKCDIYSILMMISLGNKGAVEAAIQQLMLFEKNV